MKYWSAGLLLQRFPSLERPHKVKYMQVCSLHYMSFFLIRLLIHRGILSDLAVQLTEST